MQVETIEVLVGGLSSFPMNCYIVSEGQNATHVVVIDPGADAPRLLKALGERQVDGIVLTHRHFDHIGALGELLERTGAPLYAHSLDEAIAPEDSWNEHIAGFRRVYMPSITTLVNDGDLIPVGATKLEVIHTPGHTIGSICLYNEVSGVLLAGDTLFFESVGRTDFPTGDVTQQKTSLKRLAQLPDAVVVYPGHDQSTTIGHEKHYGYLGLR